MRRTIGGTPGREGCPFFISGTGDRRAGIVASGSERVFMLFFRGEGILTMNRMSSILQKIWGWGKRHKVLSCEVLGILFLGGWIGKACLNHVSPQMFFPGYSLIDYMQMKSVEYPLPYRMCIDVPVAWGNGRFRWANSRGFVDQKYCWINWSSDGFTCINTRGETVTFCKESFFHSASVTSGVLFMPIRRKNTSSS